MVGQWWASRPPFSLDGENSVLPSVLAMGYLSKATSYAWHHTYPFVLRMAGHGQGSHRGCGGEVQKGWGRVAANSYDRLWLIPLSKMSVQLLPAHGVNNGGACAWFRGLFACRASPSQLPVSHAKSLKDSLLH